MESLRRGWDDILTLKRAEKWTRSVLTTIRSISASRKYRGIRDFSVQVERLRLLVGEEQAILAKDPNPIGGGRHWHWMHLCGRRDAGA